jgi:hypothetical protein
MIISLSNLYDFADCSEKEARNMDNMIKTQTRKPSKHGLHNEETHEIGVYYYKSFFYSSTPPTASEGTLKLFIVVLILCEWSFFESGHVRNYSVRTIFLFLLFIQ